MKLIRSILFGLTMFSMVPLIAQSTAQSVPEDVLSSEDQPQAEEDILSTSKEMKKESKSATADSQSMMGSQANQKQDVQQTLRDIKRTFGFVPTFYTKISDASLPGAWREMKGLALNDQ